ncbi:hypothetical protein AHAS_Ahas15G0215400 [Arachis hypogaea]
MLFNSSYNQTDFMGYYPPSTISNGGWEYHQEIANFEHSNQWRYDSEPQENHMGYQPPPQNDSYQYPNAFNSSYSTHQETSSLECAFNKFMQNCPPMRQDDPYCDKFNNSSSCAWEDQNQRAPSVSYSINQEPSSLEQTFNSFMINCPTSPPSFSLENFLSHEFALTQSFSQDPYNSFHQPQNSFHYTKKSSQQSQNSFHDSQDSFHTTQNNLTTTHPYPQNFSQPSSFELVSEDPL